MRDSTNLLDRYKLHGMLHSDTENAKIRVTAKRLGYFDPLSFEISLSIFVELVLTAFFTICALTCFRLTKKCKLTIS